MDAPAVESPPVTSGQVSTYKCASCGAAQTLDPGAEALICAYCGASTAIARVATPIVEHDFEQARSRIQRGPASDLANGAREVQCSNCGSRAVTTLQAKRCPFCDEPIVVDLPPSASSILPDAVVPFAVDKGGAATAYQAWLRSRWFAPNDLKRRVEHDGLDGIYVPYWTYDSDSLTRYTGARGEHYWESKSYTDSDGKSQTRQVQKTRWYSASGTVNLRFDDVQICAANGLPRKRMAALEPWDLGGLRPFDGAYLAGFIAERYSIDLEDGWTQAQSIMSGRITSAVHRDIGGDVQRIHSMDVSHRAVTFKHVLLPTWVSSFRYRGKVFRVVVNAQSGEVAGDRPWSAWKIGFLVAVIIAAIIGIVLLIAAHRQPTPSPSLEEPTAVEAPELP